MDLLLGMAEDGVHEFIWSNDLLDEWERVIVDNSERSAESAASIVSAIREFFEDGEIPTASYAAEVDHMPSADLDDRKHIAAAKVGRATVLLTRNLKHFPAAPLSENVDSSARRRYLPVRAVGEIVRADAVDG